MLSKFSGSYQHIVHGYDFLGFSFLISVEWAGKCALKAKLRQVLTLMPHNVDLDFYSFRGIR